MNPYSAPDAQLSVSVLSNETYEPRIFAWNGRIGRLRYIAYSWGMITVLMFVMGTFISIAVTAMMKGRSQPDPSLFALMGLMYIPIIAVALIMARRRLHDLDHSGWLALLLIVPLVNVFFGLYILFAAGTEGRNSYGPMPAKNSIALIIVGIILPLMFFGAMVATGVSGYLKYQEIAKAQKALQAKPTQ